MALFSAFLNDRILIQSSIFLSGGSQMLVDALWVVFVALCLSIVAAPLGRSQPYVALFWFLVRLQVSH